MNKLSEGVGKKIVEALKQQNQDIPPDISDNQDFDNVSNSESNIPLHQKDSYYNDGTSFNSMSQPTVGMQYNYQNQIPNSNIPQFNQPNQGYVDSILQQNIIQNFGQNQYDLQTDDFNYPPNVAVLRQLISKLPTGVTRQTGALIIKQTMEALGISMQSVMQDAQQVRETLNNNVKECQSNIIEYKKQIGILENKAKQYQRQSAIMNDIIGLFIHTNLR